MKTKDEKRPERKPYEAPRVTQSLAFETLAMSCGKQTPDAPRSETCMMRGSLTNS